MNNNPSTAVQSQHNPNPIESFGSEAPSRTGSVLASILESFQHTSTRIGCAFHIMAGGTLSRRGIVLDDTPDTYIVQFVDVWGLPHDEMKTVSKKRTESWKWFLDVEHSNVAYDRLFGVQ